MAEEYELGTVGPIPIVNPNVAKIGEMLKYAKKYADQYYVKDYVPLLGGMTLGDFLLGKAPEEVERWGQGDSPFRNPATVVGTGGNRLDVFKAGRFEPLLDVALNVALPAASTAQMVSKPIVRTLGPKAAEMAEDYLTKQGAIANIVEPSPKKVVEPFSAIDELGFHSPLENAILKIQQPKGTGEQFLKQLEKTPGVKTEELDVTGIKQYLLDNPTVTKQELLDQMAINRLKLQQTVLGKGSDENTYGDYQLRGGEVFDDDDYIRSLADDFHYDMKNDDVIRKQERDALLESDPDRYADYQTNPYAQARLEEDIDGSLYEQAKAQANEMYYDNPMRHYYDEHGYDIYGNDDIGYSVKDPRGNFVRDLGEHYDIDEVQNALATRLLDEGVLDYEGAGGVKFEDYTLPGNYDNYRELLVTLPTKPQIVKEMSGDKGWMAQGSKGSEPIYGKTREEAIERFQSSRHATNYQSSHFDEPNILAHTRLDDRIINGKKTLMVEEIQSDWHQAGRKKGYLTGDPVKELHDYESNLVTRAREAMKENAIKDGLSEIEADQFSTKIVRNTESLGLAKYLNEIDKYTEIAQKARNKNSLVPDAPYKKNWHELMMKQIFNEAVKGNYDAIALTTGRQQVERYENSLRQAVDEINFNKRDENTISVNAMKNGHETFAGIVQDGKFIDGPGKGKTIEEVLGKGIAKQINEGELLKPGNITGKDLTVGGEQMKTFYDEILPNFINKYGKKYGIAVKKENLPYRGVPSFDDVYANAKKYGYSREQFDNLPRKEQEKIILEATPKGDEVHFFDLSDMAKKDIKEKGQPLFSGIGLAPAPLLMDDED